MRDTLICTVGTSLFNNLKHSGVQDIQQQDIQQAFEQGNIQKLSLLLLDCNNTDRLCGAEINSITSICSKGFLQDYARLIFLVSDTIDGQKIGELLKLYYENSRNEIKFRNVEFRVLEGLRDDDVSAFKQRGLKNLVREISTEVRKFSPAKIAINATGGYKAQISFAGMIGQALEIPVYYLFEKFSEVIELPPQPVSLDLGLWLDNYVLFEKLESEKVSEKSQIKAEHDLSSEYLKTLIDEEEIDGTQYITLSVMGVLFNERSRLQFQKQKKTILSLIPQDDTFPEKKPIHLRNDHGKDVLQEFSKKICQSTYVKSVVNSLPYNPRQTDPIRRTYPDGKVEFVLTWTDEGLGICIQTTGRNMAETNSIALHLKEKFGQ